MNKDKFYLEMSELLKPRGAFNKLSKKYVDSDLYHFRKFSEMDHSAFIAWLLNKKEGHNLNNHFMSYFLEELTSNAKEGKKIPTRSELQNLIFKLEYTLQGESKNKTEIENTTKNESGSLDIYMVDPVSGWTIIIENKIDAKLGDGQLGKYKTFAMEKGQNWSKTVLVLMDASDRELAEHEDDWIDVSYNWLGRALRDAINNKYKLKRRSYSDVGGKAIKENMLESYLFKIEEYLIVVESSFYKDLLKKIKKMGCDHWELMEHTELHEIMNLKLESIRGKTNRYISPPDLRKICSTIHQNWYLFNELRDYGALEKLKSEIDEKLFEVEIKKNVLNFTLNKVEEKFGSYIDKNDDKWWPFYFQIKRDLEKKTFSLAFRISEKSFRGARTSFEASDLARKLFDKRKKKGKVLLKHNIIRKDIKELNILIEECTKYGELLQAACDQIPQLAK